MCVTQGRRVPGFVWTVHQASCREMRAGDEMEEMLAEYEAEIAEVTQ